MQIVVGVVFAGAVAAGALRLRALTTGGAIAAWIAGACVFGAGSWPFAAVLFAFFIPSTLLSKIGGARKRELADVEKTGARDAWQVFANGGAAAVCAVAAAFFHDARLAAAFAGAFAAATADTWGTEIGTLARSQPRSILTLRPISTGLSGGVTLTGTLAQAAGALFVAAIASVAGVALWWPIAAAGVAGAIADSLLGATAQELRYCPRCHRHCETDPHTCGCPTTLVRGSAWIRNDAVNLLSTTTGALVALLLAR